MGTDVADIDLKKQQVRTNQQHLGILFVFGFVVSFIGSQNVSSDCCLTSESCLACLRLCDDADAIIERYFILPWIHGHMLHQWVWVDMATVYQCWMDTYI